MYAAKDLEYRTIQGLKLGYPVARPEIPTEVYEARKEAFLKLMRAKGLDCVVIYADREHNGNFKYFTGADPRFEEGLLVIHASGKVYGALGNECLVLENTSAIPMEGVSCQAFSLPNQPMDCFMGMEDVLRRCGLAEGMRVGLTDWKLFTEKHGADWKRLFGMPWYIVEAVASVVGGMDRLSNETALLIAPGTGLRLRAEADAIAAFEFGATCASQSVLDMMDLLRSGMSEMEIANLARTYGQPLSCHTYVVSGPNCRRGLISPGNHRLMVGDPITVSVGIEGGLTCRSGMAANDARDFGPDGEYYLEEIVKPYIAAVFNWYETIGIGVRCGDIYDMIQSNIPAEKHGWKLNPGHMLSYEEWLNSPIYKGSDVRIESGNIFQMDIIPSDPVYHGPNAEDGVAIADEALREQLAQRHPEVYARIMARRRFAEEQIGLKLKPEVLPLANSFCEYRPFMLCRERAIAVRKGEAK